MARDAATIAKWAELRAASRTQVTEAIEPLRRDKVVGSSLEAEVTVPERSPTPHFLAELFITSTVHHGDELAVAKTDHHKCGRCWRLAARGRNRRRLVRPLCEVVAWKSRSLGARRRRSSSSSPTS